MDMLKETIQDTALMLPILFITYICIEYYEANATNQKDIFTKLQRFAPILGAMLGTIPQCGFSIIASMLFLERKITLGTLLSVFIATSDEALPILLTTPSMFPSLFAIIVGKIILAIFVGYIVDYFYQPNYQGVATVFDNEEEHSIIISALIRTLKIYAFIFIISFLLNLLIESIGQDTLAKLLWSNSIFQPILAALFGFIPNCIASVLLSQLYIAGSVSFASLFAGLTTNAGLGLLILYRYHLDKKILLLVISILFISAIIVGTILTLVL